MRDESERKKSSPLILTIISQVSCNALFIHVQRTKTHINNKYKYFRFLPEGSGRLRKGRALKIKLGKNELRPRFICKTSEKWRRRWCEGPSVEKPPAKECSTRRRDLIKTFSTLFYFRSVYCKHWICESFADATAGVRSVGFFRARNMDYSPFSLYFISRAGLDFARSEDAR